MEKVNGFVVVDLDSDDDYDHEFAQSHHNNHSVYFAASSEALRSLVDETSADEENGLSSESNGLIPVDSLSRSGRKSSSGSNKSTRRDVESDFVVSYGGRKDGLPGLPKPLSKPVGKDHVIERE